jgi:hypothetical protein
MPESLANFSPKLDNFNGLPFVLAGKKVYKSVVIIRHGKAPIRSRRMENDQAHSLCGDSAARRQRCPGAG